MKNLFLTICFIGVFLDKPSAQSIPNHTDVLALDNRPPHLGFRITTSLNQRAQITNQVGRYQLGSLKQVGAELGIDYYYSLTPKFAMMYGITGGFNSRNFTLFISKSDYSPAAIADQDYSGPLTKELTPYLRVPVLFEMRIFEKKSIFVNFGLGGSVAYSLGMESDGYEGYMYNVSAEKVKDFSMDLTSNNYGKPWFSFDFRLGYAHLLQNKNFAQIALVGSLASKEFIRGDYQITVPSQTISTGRYSVEQSFIGLSFSYILSKNPKLIKASR